MDAMDILGSLIGKKRNSGGLGGGIGGKILKDLLGGGRKAPAPAPQRQAERRPTPPPRSSSSLEDMLKRANDHYSQRQAAPEPPPRTEVEAFDDEAEVLVRAMVNAAKSDGQITQDEQDSIVKQLGKVSQQQVDFLRKEFAAETSVRDFAWSVPMGLEENVYTISLMSIELDANSEAQYLQELAQGLRLAPAVCNQIHDKLGAPKIFR